MSYPLRRVDGIAVVIFSLLEIHLRFRMGIDDEPVNASVTSHRIASGASDQGAAAGAEP